MSWEQVYNLLWSVGGNLELIDPSELVAAISEGPGDRETQIRIARAHYESQLRKESSDGQNKWSFA